MPAPRDGAQLVLEPLLGIGIHDVPGVAGPNQDVLPAIQVHVHEHGGPRPAAGLHPGVLRHLLKGAVPAIAEQGIALHLDLALQVAGALGGGGVGRHLGLEPARVVAEHVHFIEIRESVAVHVRDVHRHARVAGLAEHGPVDKVEGARAIVDEELVGVLEVVHHVQIRGAVPVQVGELGTEPERLVRGDGGPVRIEEATGRKRLVDEPAAFVAIELVGVGAHAEEHPAQVLAHDQLEVALELRLHLEPPRAEFPDHLIERLLLGRDGIGHAERLVVGDVEVEVAVAIHVGEGRGGPTPTGRAQAKVGALREPPRAVVEIERVGAERGEQHQVEVPVAVEVRQGGAGGGPVRGGDSRHTRDLLKPPPTEVPVQGVGALGLGEEHVHQAVAVHIPERHPGALGQDPVAEHGGVAHFVLERDPRSVVHPSESRGAAVHPELPPPVACLVVPGRSAGRTAGRQQDQDCEGASRVHLGDSPASGSAGSRSTIFWPMH